MRPRRLATKWDLPPSRHLGADLHLRKRGNAEGPENVSSGVECRGPGRPRGRRERRRLRTAGGAPSARIFVYCCSHDGARTAQIH